VKKKKTSEKKEGGFAIRQEKKYGEIREEIITNNISLGTKLEKT